MHEAEDFGRAVQAALGNRPDRIEPGQFHRFSTSTRANDKAGWCKLFNDGWAGMYGDFRTGYGGLWSAEFTKPPTLAQRQLHAIELQISRIVGATEQAMQWRCAAARNSNMWAQARPISAGDPAARYLARRGIHLDIWPQALRCHPGLDYWHEGRSLGRFPTMLGAVTDAAGQLVSLHRTHLALDGRKADVEIVKKLTACSGRLAGCSVKLVEPAGITGELSIAVAEGIETALACLVASGMPTVSAISAQGLERYQWPDEVKNLIVFADNDINGVGQRAAIALARRAKTDRLAVRVLTPPEPGTDWADVWAARVEGV